MNTSHPPTHSVPWENQSSSTYWQRRVALRKPNERLQGHVAFVSTPPPWLSEAEPLKRDSSPRSDRRPAPRHKPSAMTPHPPNPLQPARPRYRITRDGADWLGYSIRP